MAWELQQNEKTQAELDAYPRKMVFAKEDDESLTKRTITLASVIYRMIFKQHKTCYEYEDGHRTHQCGGDKRRSVEDIYSTAKNYIKKKKGFSRVTVEEAMDKLLKAKLIKQNFCGQVKRRVHTAVMLTCTLKEVKAVLND